MPRVSDGFPRKYVNSAEIGNRVLRLAIERVVVEQIDRERRWVMYFKGAKKGLVLNRTNAEYLAHAVHDDSDRWVGLAVDVFTEKVEFDGELVDGVRIRLPKEPEAASGDPSEEVPF